MIRRSLKMFMDFGLLCGTAVPTAPLFLTLVSVMLVLVLSSCEDSTVDPPRESQQVPDSTVYTDTTFFPDTIGPSVIQSFPYNEQEDVPPDINISVVFSEPIYAPSVTDTTFYLNPHVSGDLYVDSNIITLIPTPILVRNYDYELVIADSVTDSSGNNLPEGYRLSFLTESTRPTIDRFEPENGWFGVQVTVLGSGFGNSRDRATVRFGGTVAEIQGIKDSLITVLVPANAESGPLWVITNGKDSCESVGSFNVPEWEKHWAFNLDAYDIAWSDSVFVAVGVPGPWDLSIWYSHDLMNWRYDFSQSLLQHPYYSVIWADTVFVAVGRSGRVITSTDGIHWTERAVGATQYFNDVTWSGSLFVAVGRHIIMVSEDAINWRIVDSTLDNQTMSCVTYLDSKFIATGTSQTVLVSTDGYHWEKQFSETVRDLNAVAWSGEMFVAVGVGSRIISSPDAYNWTIRTPRFGWELHSVIWARERFTAFGDRDATKYSYDGIEWIDDTLSVEGLIRNIYHFGDSLLGVGGPYIFLQ